MDTFAELSEDGIAALVARFYAKVRCDTQIGPLFNAAVAD